MKRLILVLGYCFQGGGVKRMKKIVFIFCSVLMKSLLTNTIFSAAVMPFRIPDRPVAEQYNTLSWWQILCCKERINQQFLSDIALVHDMITSLKMTSPNSLRELVLKSVNDNYPLSDVVEHQLRGLGFLDRDNLIKLTWRFPIICTLLKKPLKLQKFCDKTAIEDLARKFPPIITQLHGNLNNIPRPTYTTLAVNYNLIADEAAVTPEEIAHILSINAKIDHSDPFSTFLSPKPLDDVFLDLGMVVFID